MNNIVLAFLLTVCAGAATGVGGCIALFVKKTNDKILCFSLGFSAGVMIYISMIQLMQNAQLSLVEIKGERCANAMTVLSFFGGMLLILAVNKLLPQEDNSCIRGQNAQKLWKTGIYTSLAIAIHNFPEGFATFVCTLQDASVAIPLVFAIALHNIPEGLAISLPIFYSGGSKKKAIFYSFMCGLTEPLGALIGYLILQPFLSDTLLAILFAGIAGIMVYISLDELLPCSRRYGSQALSTCGVLFGMAIMAASIFLLL